MRAGESPASVHRHLGGGSSTGGCSCARGRGKRADWYRTFLEDPSAPSRSGPRRCACARSAFDVRRCSSRSRPRMPGDTRRQARSSSSGGSARLDAVRRPSSSCRDRAAVSPGTRHLQPPAAGAIIGRPAWLTLANSDRPAGVQHHARWVRISHWILTVESPDARVHRVRDPDGAPAARTGARSATT